MAEISVLWPVHDYHREANNPENVGEMHDKDSQRDKPYFLFDRAGKEEHQQGKLYYLLKARTACIDIHDAFIGEKHMHAFINPHNIIHS
jgi:hypothetical protein